MALSQPALMPIAGNFALYALVNVDHSADRVLEQCQLLAQACEKINQDYPGADLVPASVFLPDSGSN